MKTRSYKHETVGVRPNFVKNDKFIIIVKTTKILC